MIVDIAKIKARLLSFPNTIGYADALACIEALEAERDLGRAYLAEAEAELGAAKDECLALYENARVLADERDALKRDLEIKRMFEKPPENQIWERLQQEKQISADLTTKYDALLISWAEIKSLRDAANARAEAAEADAARLKASLLYIANETAEPDSASLEVALHALHRARSKEGTE